jgi:hypothetical protein
MNTELVYKLNLPSLNEILKDNSVILKSRDRYALHDTVDILKPEWIFWNNFHWNHAVSFYRNDRERDGSNIHTDVTKPNQIPWAVNWIYGGHGILEFWLPSQIESSEVIFQQAANNTGTPVPEMQTTQPPYKIYKQPPGVYLVNTGYPHRATGWNSRIALSLRSNKNFSIPWDEVVSRFQNYILF